MVKLFIKVIPSSSKDQIVGRLDDTLKIKVRASPEKGKANRAVEKIAEKVLSLPQGSARIIGGKISSKKILEISFINETELYKRLSKLGITF